MKKNIVLVSCLLMIIALSVSYLSKKDSEIKVVIDNNVLSIKIGKNTEDMKELSYTRPLNIELKRYEHFVIKDSIIICIYLNCTETEDNYDNLLVVLYKDFQYIYLLDGLNDYALKDENYIFSYIADKTMNLMLPDTDFNIILKNKSLFFNNLERENELIDRMKHKSSVGYPNFSKGLRNIEVNSIDDNLFIYFSKFQYGFFHSDIIGEICYYYRVHYNDIQLSEIVLKPSEDYEIK